MKNKKTIQILTMLCGTLAFVVSLILYCGSFATSKTLLGTADASGYMLAFGTQLIEPYAGVLVGWIFLLITTIAALALSVIDLTGVVKLPFLQKKAGRLGIAGCFILFAIVTSVLIFCTPAYNSNASLTIGVAAVFAGIVTLLGGISFAVGFALPAAK